MGKECCSCAKFEAYYTKTCCRYLRTDCGYCSYFDQLVKKHTFACDKYKEKRIIKYKRYGLVMEELSEVVTKINVIKDFIEENK